MSTCTSAAVAATAVPTSTPSAAPHGAEVHGIRGWHRKCWLRSAGARAGVLPSSLLLAERGQAVRSAAQTQPGQRLKARLGEGELDVRVEDNHIQPATLSLLD